MKFVVALVLLVAVANARPSDLESELIKRGFFDDIKASFSQIGDVFSSTFSALGHVAAQQGAALLNTALQQGSTLLSNATATLAQNLANPQPLKRGFFDDLKSSFSQLGSVFTSTFSALGQVAAQQGAQLLNTALQQGSTLLSNATATLAHNLANPQPLKRGFFDDIKASFSQLGNVFSSTFSALGEVAAQQGAQLLNTALQQGSTLLSNATATLAQNLATPH